MVDAHCHIDQFRDPLGLARETERLQIDTVAVTNLPSHYELSVPHLLGFRFVRPAVGLHPLAAESHAAEINRMLSLIEKVAFVGEVGLDFSRAGIGTRDIQVASFRRIAGALRGKCRFVTIHSRGAEGTVLEILTEHKLSPVVFHWFTGSRPVLHEVLARGHYLSINPAMIASKNGQTIAATIPLDRVLTETDGPHVTVNGKPARPSTVSGVEEWLARHWKIEAQQIRSTIKRNFQGLVTNLR